MRLVGEEKTIAVSTLYRKKSKLVVVGRSGSACAVDCSYCFTGRIDSFVEAVKADIEQRHAIAVPMEVGI